jgi:hypothetical protein
VREKPHFTCLAPHLFSGSDKDHPEINLVNYLESLFISLEILVGKKLFKLSLTVIASFSTYKSKNPDSAGS